MKKIFFVLIFLSVFSVTQQAKTTKYCSIRGKILLENSSPVKGLLIELKNYSAKEVKSNFFWEGRAIIDKISVDHTGQYAFKGLLVGDHYLSIEFPHKMEKAYEYIQKPAMPIKLSKGQNIKDADYTLKQIRTIFSGKVYKKNAVTPYPDISLELSRDNKIYSSAVTNENGEYVFVFEPAAGQWKITVKNKDKKFPLDMDLSKIGIFENINIIHDK